MKPKLFKHAINRDPLRMLSFSMILFVVLCKIKDAHAGKIVKGGKDRYEYKWFELSNGAKVVLVRGDSLQESVVSVSIAGGKSYVDYERFMERTIFLYPEEKGGSVGHFLKVMGVFDQAHISCTEEPKRFEECLDVLSSLLTSESVGAFLIDNEGSVMHEEFLRSPFVTGDVLHMFGVLKGNGANILPENIILNRLHEFWRGYSAEDVCIVLGGNEHFKTLEDYARKYFQGIPVRKRGRNNRIRHFYSEKVYANKLIRLKTERKEPLESLVIFINIPETMSIYKKNVDGYLAFLLETPNKGGFIDALRSIGYSDAVEVSVSRNRSDTEIVIAISLLPKGWDKTSEIISLLKKYLNVIKDNTCKEVFELFKELREEDLEELAGKSLLEQAIMIAVNAHNYPMEDVIVSELVCEEYDPKVVDAVLNIMLKDNKWLCIYNTNRGSFGMAAPCYELNFDVRDHPKLTMNREYGRALRGINWSFGSFIPGEGSDRSGHPEDVTRNPERVLEEALMFANVKRHRFEDLERHAVEYIKKNRSNGYIMLGTSTMRVIPVRRAGEGLFSCGVRDDWGCMMYFVNKSFVGRDVSLCISVLTDKNLNNISMMVRCRLYFIGRFLPKFMSKYKGDAERLGVKLNPSFDGRTLKLMAHGPPPGVYALAELFFREYRQSNTECSRDEIIRCRRQMRECHEFDCRAAPPHAFLRTEAARASGSGDFNVGEVFEAIKNVSPSDKMERITSGHMCFTASGNCVFEELLDLYRKVRVCFKGEKMTNKRVYSMDGHGKYVKSMKVDRIVYVGTEDNVNAAVGVFQILGMCQDIQLHAMAILVSKVLGSRFKDWIAHRGHPVGPAYVGHAPLDNAIAIEYVVQSYEEPQKSHEIIRRFMKESSEIVRRMSDRTYEELVRDAVEDVGNPKKDLQSYLRDVTVMWLMRMEFSLKVNSGISDAIKKIKKQDVIMFLRKKHEEVVVYAVHRSDARSRC